MKRADRDELYIRYVQSRREALVGFHDLVERLLRVTDEVHFVDAENQVLDPEEGRNEGVALRLLGDPIPRVDEDQCEVRR